MEPNIFEIHNQKYKAELILEKFEPTWTYVYRIPIDDNIKSCGFLGDSIDLIKKEFPDCGIKFPETVDYVYIMDRPLKNDDENQDLYLYKNMYYYSIPLEAETFYNKLVSIKLPNMIFFESDDIMEELLIWFNSEAVYTFDWKFNMNASHNENLLALIKELEAHLDYLNNDLTFEDDFNDVIEYIPTAIESIPLVIEKLKMLLDDHD